MNPVQTPFPWDLFLFAFIAIGMVGAALFLLFRKHSRYEEGALVGEVGAHEVRLLRAGDGTPMVSLAFTDSETDLYAALTTSNALLLAQWLRIGGARGKTLAQARVNARKPAPA